MRSDMDHVPQMLDLLFDIAGQMKRQYELYMRDADAEPRPDIRAAYEDLAAGAMEFSNETLANAKELLREYEAGGGVFKR